MMNNKFRSFLCVGIAVLGGWSFVSCGNTSPTILPSSSTESHHLGGFLCDTGLSPDRHSFLRQLLRYIRNADLPLFSYAVYFHAGRAFITHAGNPFFAYDGNHASAAFYGFRGRFLRHRNLFECIL